MSFDYRMAPLIVLSDELGSDSAGRSEYRRHTEIVVYDQGINVWQHYYAGGKPSWVKLAWSTFELKPGTRYPVILKIAGQRIEITVDGHVLGVTNKDLPESYYVGLTGCEGINRFYSFSLKAR